MTKNEKIKKTLNETKEKRKNQIPVVYQLKVNLKSVDKMARKRLFLLFLEAKWFYNYLVADIQNRVSDDAYKIEKVTIKVGDTYEERNILNLSSHMKQSIISRIKQNLYSLHKKKEKGQKVGKLKFKKKVNSIPLKQYGNTFKFKNKNKTQIKIQGFKKPFRVLGGHQIPQDAEIAKAEIVKKGPSIYIYVTCYINKQKYDKTRKNIVHNFGISAGIDFKPSGIVLSSGIKVEWRIEETKRLKKLQRKLSRQKKYSKNWYKTIEKINKEHKKIDNIKADIINKVTAFLSYYKKVVFQDDDIASWKEDKFSKSVHYSSVGEIKRRLRNSLYPDVEVVDKYIPTTKTCSQCGNVQEISLAERTYKCSKCGLQIDRDLNSAINMLKVVGLDRPEVTPVERKTSARILGSSPYILVSFLQ
ncbi:MAG TPA: transposase [Thermoanaerobacter sp.]|nr:transposase [Thermoanaerobacter sp.]